MRKYIGIYFENDSQHITLPIEMFEINKQRVRNASQFLITLNSNYFGLTLDLQEVDSIVDESLIYRQLFTQQQLHRINFQHSIPVQFQCLPSIHAHKFFSPLSSSLSLSQQSFTCSSSSSSSSSATIIYYNSQSSTQSSLHDNQQQQNDENFANFMYPSQLPPNYTTMSFPHLFPVGK